jgi:hypothetical protein
MKRRAARVVISVGLVLAVSRALPAWGNPTLDMTSAPTAADITLTLRVPVERQRVVNQRVAVKLPGGFDALGCATAPGWRCTADPAIKDRPARLTWQRVADDPALTEDAFQFVVRTPPHPGSYALPVTQQYSNRTTVRWDDPAGYDHPAPILTLTDPTSPTTTTTTTAAGS